MEEIILTVQKTGSSKFKYRFGISVSDSLRYFKYRNRIVVLRIFDKIFISETTCGQFVFNERNNCFKIKKGYDLYSQEISDFIEKNEWYENKSGFTFKAHFMSKGILLDFRDY
jgi:hypothetical protein